MTAPPSPHRCAPLGAGPEGSRVGAGLRLGEAERAQHLAVRQRPQPALLLLGRAVGQKRRAIGRVVDAHDRRETTVSGRDLLERQHVGHRAGFGATPFGRHAHAHEAELTHLGEQRPRDLARRLPGADMRRHLLLRKSARGVADQDLLSVLRACGRPTSRIAAPGPLTLSHMRAHDATWRSALRSRLWLNSRERWRCRRGP